MSSPPDLDLNALRNKLDGETGRSYWRSLEEAADAPAFREFLGHEFPGLADSWDAPLTRRQLLRTMAASLALAGLSACTRQPLEKILPYVKSPEQLVPGKPLFYATTLPLKGYGRGVVVETHQGRPTKIEGNRLHPDSLGATDPFMQADILGLYDPDRSRVVLNEGQIATWSAFAAAVSAGRFELEARRGAGFRVLTETVTSPTLARLRRAFLDRYPEARWHTFEPLASDNERAGALLSFGRAVDRVYRIQEARVILSLDDELLTGRPGSLAYTRAYTDGRRAEGSGRNRLYVAEPSPTVTGSMADHRFPMGRGDIGRFLGAVARSAGLGSEGVALEGAPARWASAIGRDLARHRGRSLVTAGPAQPPAVHAWVDHLNRHLGNEGKTVRLIPSVEAVPESHEESIRALADDMEDGAVQTVLILGANPVYSAPSDLRFEERLARVPMRIHLGLAADETARLCHWHLPEAHPLESWGDLRAFDGTASLVQPMIAPLYDGRTAAQVVHLFLDAAGAESDRLVRDTWAGETDALTAEAVWRQSLHDGVVPGTAFAPLDVSANRPLPPLPGAPSSEWTLALGADATVLDGRYANNAWLQELPKPMTTLTWDNAALISPAAAERLGVRNGDVVRIAAEGRSVEAPVWILPGQDSRTVSIALGYGRSRAGRVAEGTGFNVMPLRTTTAAWHRTGISVEKTGRHHPLAATQTHFNMEGRDLVRMTDGAPQERGPAVEPAMTLYPPMPASDTYAWGMAIDLNACIGCGACTIACQAENNIPVVGKEQVLVSREMHWIRVDRYYGGPLDNPVFLHQPVPCMHCENAPCEPVCPVAATTHSREGLNEMTYNRCVGTRYCSNNCPYKVRRFNFFAYARNEWESIRLLRNPDVTVRARGVMEKCTYCVQRINTARINAEREGRVVLDGELETACQQVCPGRAIVFGNLKDEKSAVARLKQDPRNYGLLTHLNTRPRTTYLERVRNRNPELQDA